MTVAIHAIQSHNETTLHRRVAFKGISTVDVPTPLGTDFLVALLAQLRALLGEQGGMIRAVYPMTQTAVFGHGIVFPEKRAALLCVAQVAVLVDTQLLQFGWPG